MHRQLVVTYREGAYIAPAAALLVECLRGEQAVAASKPGSR
ncbi:hypothetical protein F783_002425 [Bordetella holmesii F627]|nr:LysR family transcriptional regulator [Bordetella holmesii]AMD50484.1 hypothetical protein F783_002425 [Bordetella holmesii F627]